MRSALRTLLTDWISEKYPNLWVTDLEFSRYLIIRPRWQSEGVPFVEIDVNGPQQRIWHFGISQCTQPQFLNIYDPKYFEELDTFMKATGLVK